MANRALVVDDSLLMRRMICETLTDAGWEIAGEGEDGAEAIRLYEELRPDAVTMDIVMPGTDGIYALEKIIESDPEARVVVVSALSQTKLISQAIRKGAQDFIAKPFLPEQLQATLQSCLAEPVASQ
jgi:two-component system, chemotaxis family, chemotaxis protein CheY